jgi:NADH-quinone oxidoreductase subunit L
VGGLVQVPLLSGGQRLDAFLEPVFADATAAVGGAAGAAHAPGAEIILMVISLAVALSGIFVAHRFYVADPDLPCRLAERAKGLYRLLFNKYWIDEVYDSLIVQPIYRGSVRLWERFDAAVIDGAVNGVGKQIERGAALLRQAQMGYVQVYALILTLGAVVVLGYLALR